MVPSQPSRRAFLALAGSAAAAGCTATSLPGSGANESTETGSPTHSSPRRVGGPAPEGSWPALGRDNAHAGYDPTSGSDEPSLAWKSRMDGPLTAPVVVGDTAYLTRGAPVDEGKEATLEAYALDTGERRWSESLGAPFGFHAPQSDFRPVYRDGALYLCVDDSIVAFDLDSRERVWETAFESKPNGDGASGPGDMHAVNDPPVVTDDAVYVCDVFGNALACLNRDDGSRRWTFEADGVGAPRLPAVGDGVVYAPLGASLVALHPDDGSAEWRYPSGEDDPNTHATATVLADGTLVRGGMRAVEAIDTDGSLRWHTDGVGAAVIRPGVANGTVYVPSLEGDVRALDLDTGETLWSATAKPTKWMQGTVPVTTDGALHLLRVGGGDVTVRAFDPDSGEEMWHVSRPGVRGRGPVPSRGTLLLTAEELPEKERNRSTMTPGQDRDGTLYAFSIGSGDE